MTTPRIGVAERVFVSIGAPDMPSRIRYLADIAGVG
jgi:hypothetical protein